MSVKLIKNKDCFRMYEASFGKETISTEYNKVLKKASSEIAMDGFKKGSVPVDVIENRYGERILNIVADNLQRKILKKVLEDDKLTDSIAHIEEHKPLAPYSKDLMKMTFNLQLNPELPIVKYEKIKLDLPILDLTDADVVREIERISVNFSTTKIIEKSDAEVANGNIVIIDFIGRLHGEVIQSACASDFSLDIGSGSFVPGFEEKLIGMKAGDQKTIVVTFPKEYHEKSFANQNVEFDINLKAIREKELPEIDDALAVKFGFKNLSELKDRIKSDISNFHEDQVKKFAKIKVDEYLRDKYCNFTVPDIFLLPEIKRLKDFFTTANIKQPEKSRKSEKDIDKESLKKANENVCMSYFYRDIIKSEKINPTEDAINMEIMQEAMASRQNYEELLKQYEENPENKSYIVSKIQENEAFNFIFSKINLNRYKISLDKFQDELTKLYKNLK